MKAPDAAGLADALADAADRVPGLRATVMPDVNLDHLVPLPSLESFQADVQAVHARGGGNRVAAGHRIRVGGNAANLAHALARLGVTTSLVARCDRLGEALLRQTFEGLPVDLDALERSDRTASTVALEFPGANVMLSDPGPHGDVRPEDLSEAAWRHVEEADAVAVTNWSQTRHGTQLLEAVLPRAKRAGAVTFLDTGDPSARRGDAGALLSSPALKSLDAWGMNGVEAAFFGDLAGALPGAEPETCARALRDGHGFDVDLHTGAQAVRLTEAGAVRVPSFTVPVLHCTGAGDAWNAGDLLGRLLGLEPEQGLALAHAVAALTVSSETGRPPDLATVLSFLRAPPPETEAATTRC